MKDSALPSAVMYDMDGTLSDCRHRRPFVTDGGHDWDAFYANVLGDKPRKNTIKMLQADRRKYAVLVVTGRPARCVGDTRKWMDKHGIKCDGFYCRRDGDHREDYIVKEELYHAAIEPAYNVIKVVDDRPQVIRMWKRLGLKVHDVGDGKEF